jgi:non-canonical purine NTP pyrophosphatase (RdgB/HAM1 family)
MEALYDRQRAHGLVFKNLLERQGYASLDEVRSEGRVEGRIVSPPRGKSGFGYDPVFFHAGSGCTFAELPMERKNEVSHRGRALRELARRLPETAAGL